MEETVARDKEIDIEGENMNVVVVGSLNMDVFIPVDTYPGSGETVKGGNAKYLPGGKGANQALAAARQGANVTMVGMVGADANGEALRASLEADGVNCSLVQTFDGPTGIAFVHLEKDGSNRIILSSGANDAFLPDRAEAYKDLVAHADAVLFQLEIPIETVGMLVRVAMEAGVPTYLDPAPARSDVFTHIPKVDWITPNEHEAQLLTGIKVVDATSARLACAKLQQLGAKRVLLKVGSQGTYVADENGLFYQPGIAVPVVDTTAAGDAFTAAFVVEYLRGESVYGAARMACAAGALAVTRLGAQPSLPYRDEVVGFLETVDAALSSKTETTPRE